MLYTDFCNEFNVCIENGNYDTANRLIARELGTILASNKSDFVTLLNESGIPAQMSDSNLELINRFVDNVPFNTNLRVGASLLVNSYNQEVSFNGNKNISKDNVRNCYRVMTNQYNKEKYSNAIDPISAVAETVGAGLKLGTSVQQGKNAKRQGGLDYAKEKEASKQAMIQSLMEQKKAQLDAQTKQKEQQSKTNKMIYIVGGSLLGLVVIGVTIFKLRQRK